MALNAKQKNCRRKECKKPFRPKTEWQKYCSNRCRDIMGNRKRAAQVKAYKRLMNKQQQQPVVAA